MKASLATTALLLFFVSSISAKDYERPLPVSQDLTVLLVLNQQELGADTSAGNTALRNDGLLGMMIAGAQVSATEARVVPIRNLLLDYRFERNLEAAVRAKLPSEGISPHPNVSIMSTPWDYYSVGQGGLTPQFMMPREGAPEREGVYLLLMPRHSLSNDGQVLAVELRASLVLRESKSSGKFKNKLLFTRNYSFKFLLDPIVGSTEDNVRRWVKIGGPRIKQMLDLGINQVTDMLAYDFSPAGRAEGAVPVKNESGRFQDLKTFGRQLRAGDHWYWTRNGKDPLQAIQGMRPIRSAEIGPDGAFIDSSPDSNAAAGEGITK